MKQRLKSYKFWVALSSAIIILLKSIGVAFGFDVNGEIINSIILAFCGVLVVFGVIEKPDENITKNTEENVKKNTEKNTEK